MRSTDCSARGGPNGDQRARELGDVRVARRRLLLEAPVDDVPQPDRRRPARSEPSGAGSLWRIAAMSSGIVSPSNGRLPESSS